MKHVIIFILLLFCIPVFAQQKIAREYIEWSDVWISGANKTDLPHVLLIGNSITRGYYGKVEQALRGKAYIGRLSNSKSVGDPALLEEIAVILKNTQFDIIHFNNGLHGFDYTEEEYDKKFPKLIKVIRKYAPKAKLIWATITPVRAGKDMKEFAPITERLKVRNKIALKHINRAGIEVNDLWKVVIDHPEYYLGGDGTHPIDTGYSALADQVSKVINSKLSYQ
ncbi:SGNH/GDSL hydrolase family protein [Bacteroides sp. f07]|uniref:SGNH/GDSL hydrolase family protein n=1 Tax=Bacteroides sp. f07 TaxID=3132704 RepID=UPI0034B451A0